MKTKITIMNVEQLRQFTVDTIKWVLRIAKPWKKNGTVYDSREEVNNAYLKGWNDCVNEVAKEGRKLSEFIEDKMNTIEEYRHTRA